MRLHTFLITLMALDTILTGHAFDPPNVDDQMENWVNCILEESARQKEDDEGNHECHNGRHDEAELRQKHKEAKADLQTKGAGSSVSDDEQRIDRIPGSAPGKKTISND